MPTPMFNLRLEPYVIQGIREHAERRGQSASDYLRPMLKYMASIDNDDEIWGELAPIMRMPKVPRKPVAGNY